MEDQYQTPSTFICTNCQNNWLAVEKPDNCPMCNADKYLIEKYHVLLQRQLILARLYRKNVGIIIVNNKKEFLICQRADNKHWQFPQGGVDNGEKHIDALFREIYEEIGTLNVQVVSSTENTYKYDWPKHMARRDNFSGQEQRYYLLKFTGEPGDITIDQREFQDFKWVDQKNLLSTVEPVRLLIYEQVLEEFKEDLKNI